MKRRRTAIAVAVVALALVAAFGKTFIEFVEELKTMADEIAAVKEEADSDANAAGAAQALAMSEVDRYVDEIEVQMQEDADSQSRFQTEYDSKYAEVNNAISEAERASDADGVKPFSESDYSTIEEALASSINPVPTPSDGLVKIEDIYGRYRVFKDGEGAWHMDSGVLECNGNCGKKISIAGEEYTIRVCNDHLTDEYAIQLLTSIANHVAIARKMGLIYSSDITNNTIPQ